MKNERKNENKVKNETMKKNEKMKKRGPSLLSAIAGVTVTVYLEPGIRASGLNLWLLEVLAAFCLGFDGPAGGAGAVLDDFVVSSATAHLVQQVEVVNNSPTTPHSPVSLTLMALPHTGQSDSHSKPLLKVTGSWHDDNRSLSLRRCLWDHGDRKSASNGSGRRRRSPTIWSWPGWSSCARRDAGLLLGRSKGPVIEHVSLTQANAQGHQEELQQKGGLAGSATHCGTGCGYIGSLEEGANTLPLTKETERTSLATMRPSLIQLVKLLGHGRRKHHSR